VEPAIGQSERDEQLARICELGAVGWGSMMPRRRVDRAIARIWLDLSESSSNELDDQPGKEVGRERRNGHQVQAEKRNKPNRRTATSQKHRIESRQMEQRRLPEVPLLRPRDVSAGTRSFEPGHVHQAPACKFNHLLTCFPHGFPRGQFREASNEDVRTMFNLKQLEAAPPLSQSRHGDMACETLYVCKHVQWCKGRRIRTCGTRD